MIDRYFDRFPGVRNYIHETLNKVRETGFTTTLFGRKTHFPGIRSKVQHERQGAERAAINAPIQGTSADIIKRAMAAMGPALRGEGLTGVRMLMQVHDELVFEVPEGGRGSGQRRDPPRHGRRRRARGEAQRAARHRHRHRHPLGPRALSAADPGIAAAPPDDDIAALARGGRTNVFGFALRLIARLPFLFIAGQLYGAEALGRFAYAVIVVEFAAQLATLGLKRGLAQQLRASDQPQVCTVWDAMLAAFIASAVASALLMLLPQAMFPNSERHGADFLLPLVIFGIAGADVASGRAGLSPRHRRDRAGPRHRRAVDDQHRGRRACFYSTRDGLISPT
jgi:hypothetical protein